ncbi:hypothetical protein NLI96_g6613 [Meripilus lineatus]|uniref:DUF6535 domain-containing protein n=1 Tax=Meripilus lineatus TaxID=2056292 RepID=A0AAD5YFR9_9APHY|nr:hypothetical protein NLI96_g6613 [Physisporinus lineatus]
MSNDANIEEEATFAAEKEQPITKNVSPKVASRTGRPSNPVLRAWSNIGRLVREYNENTVTRTTEDLDTLLVFVGLFSAVVSAFLAVSFQALQEDPADVTARTLIIISQQLSSLSLQSGSLNTTIPAAIPSSSFTPSTVAKIVNILWISCLATSLMVSFGVILLKFILRLTAFDHHLTGISQPRPKEYRARYFRLLEDTTAFRLALGLPLLTMVSLAMFLVGLLLFTIQLNHLVAGLSVLLVELPLWLWILQGISPLIGVILQHIQYGMKAEDPRFLNADDAAEQQRKWDISVLVATERFVGQDDGTHMELTQQCLADAPTHDIYSYVRQILPERASRPFLEMPSLKEIPPDVFKELSDESLTASVRIIGDAIAKLLIEVNSSKWMDDYAEGVSFLAQIDPLRAIPCIPELFGKLIETSNLFATEVLLTLNEYGWKVQPTLSGSLGLRNLVQALGAAIKLDQVGSPLEACYWLLGILTRTATPIIEEHTNEIQSLLDTICSASQSQMQAAAPSVASQGAENILQTITSLNTKCPGLIRGNVVDIITQGLARSKTPDLEPDVQKGKWDKLQRLSEAVSRSRRRPDLMVRAA